MPADYYQTLEVAKDADDRDLKKAYRSLALKYHPDRNPGDAAAEDKFKEVSEAYEVLADPQKRQIYDRFGHEGLKSRGAGGSHSSSVEDIFSHFGDIFGDIFGRGGGGRGRPRRGADLLTEVEILLVDCLTPTQRVVEIPREIGCAACAGSGAKAGTKPIVCATCGGIGQVQIQSGLFSMVTPCTRCGGQGKLIKDPCGTCRGVGRTRTTSSVKVTIPPGIEAGMRLRVTGQGEDGPGGAPPGDLYVVVQVRDHDRFERHGADLLAELPIDLVDACLGGKTTFESLDGPVPVEIAAGTQSHSLLRVRGRGMPRLEQGGKGRGDLHLRVTVTIPRKLSDEQTRLLQALRDSFAPPKK